MVDQMVHRMVIKGRVKKAIWIACVLLVIGLLAYEGLYIRVYDASIPSMFAADYTAATESLLQNLTAADKTVVDAAAGKEGSARVRVSLGSTYDTFSDQYATSSSYQIYALGAQSAAAISRWTYDHHNGLYKTLFDSDSGFLNPSAVSSVRQWYEETFPTKEEQKNFPYYRYFVNICVQKENVRYNMNIFCKNPELLDSVLAEVVDQVNRQAG